MSKTYFASDFHLGTPDYQSSLQREKKIVSWLDCIKEDAQTLFLVGDVFDFWYEYRHAIPKYHTRILAKLAEFTDAGIKVYFFKGNHDMWTFDYLSKEIGLEIIDEEWTGSIGKNSFFIHHGDALGPGDYLYKGIRKLFRSSWAIWLFHRLHPNFGIGLANYLSRKSRAKNMEKDLEPLPLEQEFQYQFALDMQKKASFDYYIFGHRHQPRNETIGENSRFINLGDWVNYNTYAVYDGHELELKTYTD